MGDLHTCGRPRTSNNIKVNKDERRRITNDVKPKRTPRTMPSVTSPKSTMGNHTVIVRSEFKR